MVGNSMALFPHRGCVGIGAQQVLRQQVRHHLATGGGEMDVIAAHQARGSASDWR